MLSNQAGHLAQKLLKACLRPFQAKHLQLQVRQYARQRRALQ